MFLYAFNLRFSIPSKTSIEIIVSSLVSSSNTSKPSTTYPKAAFLPSIKLRPAGFNSASYKKKKNCDDPSSTAVFE